MTKIDVTLQPYSPKADLALTVGLVAFTIAIWCAVGWIGFAHVTVVSLRQLIISDVAVAALVAAGWLWLWLWWWRRALIVFGYVLSVVTAMCSGVPAAVTDPDQYPAPAPAQTRVQVSQRGQQTVGLLSTTVLSAHPSAVQDIPACTVTPRDRHRAGQGHQVWGSRLVDVPEQDQLARPAAVRDDGRKRR